MSVTRNQILAAADVIEFMSRIYEYKPPAEGLWSAAQLRYEAKHLETNHE